MDVRGLAGIVPDDAATATEHSSWQRNLILKNVVSKVIENVNAPVAHLPRARVPDPVPVVVKLVAVHRQLLSGAKPEVVGEAGGSGQRCVPLADRLTDAKPVHAGGEDSSERLLLVEELLDLSLHGVGALLRPELTNPLVFSGGGDDLPPFPLAM